MPHRQKTQRYVYKIHSSRLKKSGWDLTLSTQQARENKELIGLAENQLIRFIDELNNARTHERHIINIKEEIRHLTKDKNRSAARPRLRKCYEELDRYLFCRDYVCVIIDSLPDYRHLFRKGFRINGITYQRLLGTVNGVKSNTIVFINHRLYPEIKKRMDNGRNLQKTFAPAKLESYYSLICSSSIPVSMPDGVAVVHDCLTHFKADVIELDDTHGDEPDMKYIRQKEITLNESDGYGLAMPDLMKRWGRETGVDYLLPGCVIRNSFCKGAVFPVDFQNFAVKHGKDKITDVWGNTHKVTDIELILTESMLKLWDSYSSLSDYLDNCKKNNYTFAITKFSEKQLENERCMNYQFLQSYDFTDREIDDLVAPTVQEINDILYSDYRKTILYAKGTSLDIKNRQDIGETFADAIMIEPKMFYDPYVKKQLDSMIQKRIDDAKTGALTIPANYSFVSGDPYSLCQSMFGMEVTGLLKAGEVYSKYWVERGIEQIVSFRAPMTSHNNIRLLKVVHTKEMDEFYQYMTTPTIFNSWDTCADAMNGFDKDGDCVLNTAFPLLIKTTKELPAILCVQRKCPKCIPSEQDMMQANINSFGNAIGEITNRITSMYEVQANFSPDSEEYKTLDYRIKCGQLYQQNAIDQAKGIDCRPMPEHWYRKTSSGSPSICADKKPYFMKYIYSSEKKKFDEYNKKNNAKCLMRFRITLEELLAKKEPDLQETEFIDHYKKRLPLGTAPCTANKICWKMESVFDHIKPEKTTPFDYSVLKSNAKYDNHLFQKIKKIYEEYQREIGVYSQITKKERMKQDERQMQKHLLKENFKRKCTIECPNEDVLCNIVLDLCYPKSSSKQFAWDICGKTFIKNLLKRNNYEIQYPVHSPDGDIIFRGERFRMKTVKINPAEKEESECRPC